MVSDNMTKVGECLRIYHTKQMYATSNFQNSKKRFFSPFQNFDLLKIFHKLLFWTVNADLQITTFVRFRFFIYSVFFFSNKISFASTLHTDCHIDDIDRYKTSHWLRFD